MLADTANQPWSVLLSGHRVLGFLQFRSELTEPASTRDHAAALSSSQVVQIEHLHDATRRGQMNLFDLESRLERIVGNTAINYAFAGFGFWGSILRVGPRHRFSRALRLDRRQIYRARAAYARLHDKIEAKCCRRIGDTKRILTPEQMDRISKEAYSPEWLRVRVPLFEMLADRCDLSTDQQLAMSVSFSILRSEVRVAHQAARKQFMRMLTNEQRRLLDVIENAISRY